MTNIVVAVDYLGKWVEVMALADATARQIAKFFISDQGKGFTAEVTHEVLDLLRLYPDGLYVSGGWMADECEASLMSDTRGWKDTTAKPQKPYEQLPNLSVVYSDQQADFIKTMRELIQDTCEKLISKEKNDQVKSRGPFKPKGRTLTGKPQCFYCKKSGHIARNCFKIPESEQYKGPPNDAALGGNLPIN
ncbi:hypothetical protein OUZ56_026476 [Daphnia magna]|uniref:CCHC-type domain-containing protein n=1 Tax=Daphnia magna TaxID=35525 RepID=A0ABQ9ZLU3_9CRUS|nr:hypothetical protein OUZ56_026476 [Daphnia magna]